MSNYRRNVLLGATIIFALAMLGWMILKFGANIAEPFAAPTITVKFVTERADGVADGSPVTFRGVDSGHVTRVWIDEQTREKVYFEALVNRDPPLPSNVIGVIKSASLLGSGSAIALETEGAPAGDALREGQLVQARFVGLGDILPTQFGELAAEMTKTVRQMRESNLVGDLDAQVKNAGRLIESMQKVVGDSQTQGDLKTALTNLRDVSENAKTLSVKLDTNVDALSRQIGDRLTQVGKLVDQFQSIAGKINDGKGTAGALVNDQKLYQSLVESTAELTVTVKDLNRLIEQWEQEGVTLKLK